jgi:hypothetical protein
MEVDGLDPDGSNSIATWRTSSTAASGCRPDAVAGTHQAPQARPSPGWARKVPASTLLHVGRRRRCRPAPPRATASAPGDVASGSSLARPSPEGPCRAQIWAGGTWPPPLHRNAPPLLRRRETNLPCTSAKDWMKGNSHCNDCTAIQARFIRSIS